MALGPTALRNRLFARAKLRHLQALSRLVDLHSMGRAALAMGLTQPAMSQLIADLEALMEVRLFQRHAKGVDPTPLALSLAAMARRVLREVEDSAELVAARHQRNGSLVRVAASSAAAAGVLAQALPGFARAHPGVQVHVSEVSGPALDACLIGEDFEIVCCRAPVVPPAGWHFDACLDDESVVVCAVDHPLVRRAAVSADDLRRADWLLAPMSTMARQHYETYIVGDSSPDGPDATAVRPTARPPESPVITREVGVMWGMLKQAPLLTLLPRSLATPYLASGVLASLSLPFRMPLEPIGVFWRPQRAEAATALLVEHALTVAAATAAAPG